MNHLFALHAPKVKSTIVLDTYALVLKKRNTIEAIPSQPRNLNVHENSKDSCNYYAKVTY